MLKRNFKQSEPYQIVIYARYSTAQQNERSCQQQVNTIHETIHRNRYPWTTLRIYQDDGVKGRYDAKHRPGSGQMLRDIETGIVKPDLIAVDTWERFGRYDEAQDLRRELEREHGVLIVTADSNFSDPTGMAGKAIGLVENIRATEGNRVKSHDVVRGKKDALRRGRWPGGPPPFGYRLNRQIEYRGNEPHHFSTLEHDPATIWIRQELMRKACETGWGPTRLARWLNQHDDIPAQHKPFYDCTVKLWLVDPLNVGTYVWNEHNTDIVNSCRVIEKNPDQESIDRIEGFCEPVVERDIFDRVLQMAEARRRPREIDQDGKIIRARSAGRTLEHCLTGLVVCECNASMIACRSGRRSQSGTEYVYRRCPRSHNGACDNRRHIRECELERAVLTRLRARLLPAGTGEGEIPGWFPEIVELVQQSVDEMNRSKPDVVAAKNEQIRKIEANLKGWLISLGNHELRPTVRADIIEQYDAAKAELNALRSELSAFDAAGQLLRRVVDPKAVLERLRHLDQLLAESNPTLLNIELSKHIAEIRIDRTGKIVMVGTNLGMFDGAIELLSLHPGEHVEDDHEYDHHKVACDATENTNGCLGLVEGKEFAKVRPRRRARRRVSSLSGDHELSAADVRRGLDPDRFAGLEDDFLWDEDFTIAPRECWYEANADRIYAEWLEVKNLSELERRHGVSRPTIRKARDLGKKNAEAKMHPPS